MEIWKSNLRTFEIFTCDSKSCFLKWFHGKAVKWIYLLTCVASYFQDEPASDCLKSVVYVVVSILCTFTKGFPYLTFSLWYTSLYSATSMSRSEPRSSTSPSSDTSLAHLTTFGRTFFFSHTTLASPSCLSSVGKWMKKSLPYNYM